MVLFAVFALGCDGAQKYVGTWAGKTSQDFDITVKVESVGGSPTVTELKYAAKMQASYGSSTRSMLQPAELSAKITTTPSF